MAPLAPVVLMLAVAAAPALAGCAEAALTADAAPPVEPAPEPRATGPLVMAHRGGAAEAPENTMIAFERAVALGVDVLEMDVQWSADGVPVVIHDATLDRTTDCSGPVNARTMAELRECNACATFCAEYPFVPLSSFEDVLQRFSNASVAINVEIKNVPTDPATFDPLDRVLLPAMIDLVRAHPEYVPDRILVSSFNFKTTTHLTAMASEIPVALLTLNPADAHGEAAIARATMLDALQPTKDGLRPENAAQLVADAHALGLDVHVWTVDDAATMRFLADVGVDGIISNRPTRLVGVLGS